MVNNILIPTDFTPASTNAMKWGAMIAKKTEASIQLLHVVNMPVGWQHQSVKVQQEYPELEGAMVEGRIKLDKLMKDRLLNDVPVTAHLEGEVPFEQIPQFATLHHSDLIIMGVHTNDGGDHSYIGSTAQKVLRRTQHIPVLSVKTDTEPHPIRKLLFASTFDENVKPVINTLKNLAVRLGADIDLVNISTRESVSDEKDMEQKMKSFIHAQSKVKFGTIVYSSVDIEEGILNAAVKQKADIIAMVTHLRKEKADYSLSTTEGVVLRSAIPIMSFITGN